MLNQEKKVAVITGASSGIGRETAIHLAVNNGYDVVLASRNEEEMLKVREAIEGEGGQAFTFPVDVAKETQVRKLASFVKKELGKVNVLFNNAGVGIFKPLWELSGKEWKAMHDTMVYGTFLTTRYLLPLMMDVEPEEPRHILINSSLFGVHTKRALCSAYVSAKSAQRAMADSLREELRSYNIKVTCLVPGSVDTAFYNSGGGWPHNPDRILSSRDVAMVVEQIISFDGNVTLEEVVVQGVNPD